VIILTMSERKISVTGLAQVEAVFWNYIRILACRLD
jgi:hypothetical protein